MSIYLYDQYILTPSNLVKEVIARNTNIIVCIPCFNEEEALSSVRSLFQCEKPIGNVEIIILINDREDSSGVIKAQNEQTYDELYQESQENDRDWIRLYAIYVSNMPRKKGGVGLARRIAMDEAVARFNSIDNPNGIIACYDADSHCDRNYFVSLEKYFEEHPKLTACSIHYEHPFAQIKDEKIKSSIIDYELHLRYYINMQRLLALPYAYQTVGSSMAVLVHDYVALGGMNTRKAGEDFYFLQKFIAVERCGELNTTKVIPSCRPSDRVPFGTGRAVNEMLASDLPYQTYNFKSFEVLEEMLSQLEIIYASPQKCISHYSNNTALVSFFQSMKWNEKIEEIIKNTTDYPSFYKRFYRWFNAFALMKCLHFMRDNGNTDIPVKEGIKYLFERLLLLTSEEKSKDLKRLRDYDRGLEK